MLVSKSEYLIFPKETKFTGLGKLALKQTATGVVRMISMTQLRLLLHALIQGRIHVWSESAPVPF